MSVDTFLFVLSLMSNRSLTVTGFHRHGGDDDHSRANAYDYYPGILLYNSTVEDIVMAASPGMSFWVPWFSSLFHTDFSQIFENSRLIQMEGLLYASILYVQPQMARFALDNFGLHALYFVSNFIIRVPKSHFTTAEQVVQTVPRAVCLMGVHLRLQYPGQFYSYLVEQTIRVAVPFLKEIQKTKPTVFGFASDSPFMEAAFKKVFKKNVRVTAAIRAADFDHDSALIDIAFLEMCDDCLLSYRSTFSFAVASRRGTRAYFIEKEATGIFQIANSQAGALSMLFHRWDHNDWQTARRFEVSEDSERTMRFFYKWLLI
jgi:hypothetical protein